MIRTDVHTHTIASGHAYSTVEENCRAAGEQGLELIGITDHFSPLFVSSTDYAAFGSFLNRSALPPCWHGVRLLFGAEVDIMDLKGTLFGHDLIFGPTGESYEERILSKLDYLIASVHDRRFTEGASAAACTECYIGALQHPGVKILGHMGRSRLSFDMDAVIREAVRLGKMIEINEASFGISEEIDDRCRSIAEKCAAHGCRIAVSSDAHSSYYIGKYPKAEKLLKKIAFPEELIANRSAGVFLQTVGIER